MQQRVTPQRRHFPEIVYDRAQELLNDDPQPTFAAIAQALKNEARDLRLTDDELPTSKAISEWADKGWIIRNAEDAPWSIDDSPPEDAALILPLIPWFDSGFIFDRNLAQQLGAPSPRRRRPTVRQAKWIAKVRRIAPDLEDFSLIGQAAAKLARGGEQGRLAEDFLAYAPWREAEPLFESIEAGVVPNSIVFEFGYESDYGSWKAAASRKETER